MADEMDVSSMVECKSGAIHGVIVGAVSLVKVS